MKADRILELVDSYERRLKQTPAIKPKEFTSSGEQPNRVHICSHVMWLCGETRQLVEKGRFRKAYGSVKLIQGVLFASGIMTIGSLKDEALEADAEAAE